MGITHYWRCYPREITVIERGIVTVNLYPEEKWSWNPCSGYEWHIVRRGNTILKLNDKEFFSLFTSDDDFYKKMYEDQLRDS